MDQETYILTEAEQEEARKYVCERYLTRPATTLLKAGIYVLTFFSVVILLSLFTLFVLLHFKNICISRTLFLSLLIYVLIGLLIITKKAIIGMINLYQHYAPERIRRKCIFKPTCSEYMILALEKYGLFKGLYKSIYRMFFRCSGFYYSIKPSFSPCSAQ